MTVPTVTTAGGPPQGPVEQHSGDMLSWLRAAVLGADDGILSTASLLIGIAAAHGSRSSLVISGAAALVAGAMSMAAGEYVSVHSQADSEAADLAREQEELRTDNAGEHRELAAIYVGRGLTPDLARQVADQLMAHDALGAHARDELGFTPQLKARPGRAAFASAASFAIGAAVPVIVALAVPMDLLPPSLVVTSLVSLGILGAMAARAGGAGLMAGALRTVIWGAIAMGVTGGVGWLVGTVT